MKNKRWSHEEKEILETYILETKPGEYNLKELSDLLKRSLNAVYLYSERFGLANKRKEKFKDVKYCASCQQVLPQESFSFRSSNRANERKSRCKNCDSNFYKQNYQKWLLHRLNRRADPLLLEHDLKKQKEYKIKNIPRIMFLHARKNAKAKNIPIDITPDDIIVPSKCPLLGIKLEFNGLMNNRDSSPSLDRIDSFLGYIKDNIWVISYRANRIKNDASLKELERISKNLRKKLRTRKSLQKLRKR